jgi:MYXO-CTERM domain-containing protein
MRRSNLSKAVGISALALSTAILPLNTHALAQNTTGNSTAGTSSTTGSGTQTSTTDNGPDWGWLGLLGLIGLAGLFRKRPEPARYQDPGSVSSTTYRD